MPAASKIVTGATDASLLMDREPLIVRRH